MTVNELRIGNYVYDDENDICTVVRIEDSAYTNWNSGDDYNLTLKTNNGVYIQSKINPIPLTEECLLKFGFEAIPESSDEFRYIDKKNGFSLELSEYYKKDGRAVFYYNLPNNDNHICISYCKYVHQLQNLYFALTGKELLTK